MLHNVFRKVYWYTPLLLLLGGALLWLDAFVSPEKTLSVLAPTNAPLFTLIKPLILDHPLAGVMIAFLVLMVQVVLINHIASSNGLTDRYSALTGLLYLLLMCSTPGMIAPHPLLFANLFLLLALNKILKEYQEHEGMAETFNSGMLIAIAGLFYLPALLFFLLLIFSMVLYFRLNMRSIVASLLGFATPFFFLGLYYFMADMLHEQLHRFTITFRPWLIFKHSPDINVKASILGFVAFSLLSIARLIIAYMPDKLIRLRRRVRVLLLLFFVSALSYLFVIEYIHLHHALLAIPLSISLAIFFDDLKKGWLSELVFGILLLFILAGRFAGYWL